MEADDVLTHLGRCGRYQQLVFLLMSMVCMRGVWQLFAPIYLGADPGHHCKLPDNGSFSDVISGNDNFSDVIVSEQCQIYSTRNHSNSSQYCPFGWTYGDEFEETILTEWDLVCDNSHLLDVSSSVFMSGMLAGSIFLTPLADKFGRKKLLLASLWIQGVVGIATAFSNSFVLFAVLRFVMGTLNQAIGLVSCVILPEAFPSSNRSAPYIGMFIFWSAGVMSLALLGYFIRNWRYLQIAISLPNFLTVVFYWILPESIPWLISTERTEEAKNVIKCAAKMNKIDLQHGRLATFLASSSNEDHSIVIRAEGTETNAEIEDSMSPLVEKNLVSEVGFEPKIVLKTEHSIDRFQNEDSKTLLCKDNADRDDSQCMELAKISSVSNGLTNHSNASGVIASDNISVGFSKKADSSKVNILDTREYGILDLFKTRKMRLYSILIFYLWFANSLGYFGMTFLVSNLHGDPFMNLFLSGLVELPAYLVAMYSLERMGRRRPLCVFMIGCGVFSIISTLIPETTASGDDLTWLKRTTGMVAKFGVTGAYVTIYLLCVEIFPTVLRNLGTGLAAAFETFGAMAAPFIASSGKSTPQLPLIVFAVLTIIGGGLCLILPETHGKPLPETIEEVEGWQRAHVPANGRSDR